MDEEVAKAFGHGVRRLREKRGWTLVELALRVGSSKQHVWRVEAGGREPKLGTCMDYAAAFGVSLRTLLEECEALRKGRARNGTDEIENVD